MIRPPSLQKPYDAFWSHDPAIRPLPKEATDAQKTEHARLLKLALDTGHADRWAEITTPGETITRFAMAPLSSEQYLELRGMLQRGATSDETAVQAFKFALRDVGPLPEDVKVTFIKHPKYEAVATLEFFDKMKLSPDTVLRIAIELGELAWERAKDPDPL